MRHILLALCAFGLTACGDTTNPDDSSGGLAGVPLEQVAELGLECEAGKYAQYRKVKGDLCVPNAPAFDDLITDCKLIADAGCLPVAVGCGYAPAIIMLADEDGAQFEGRFVPGFERQTADFETSWMSVSRSDPALGLPSAGDPDFIGRLAFVDEADADCIREVRPSMTGLGQWVWRDE